MFAVYLNQQSSAVQARSWNIFKVKGVELSLLYYGQKVHITKLAREWLFEGYEDPIITVAKDIASILGVGDIPFDRFGWFYQVRNILLTWLWISISINSSSETIRASWRVILMQTLESSTAQKWVKFRCGIMCHQPASSRVNVLNCSDQLANSFRLTWQRTKLCPFSRRKCVEAFCWILREKKRFTVWTRSSIAVVTAQLTMARCTRKMSAIVVAIAFHRDYSMSHRVALVRRSLCRSHTSTRLILTTSDKLMEWNPKGQNMNSQCHSNR